MRKSRDNDFSSVLKVIFASHPSFNRNFCIYKIFSNDSAIFFGTKKKGLKVNWVTVYYSFSTE